MGLSFSQFKGDAGLEPREVLETHVLGGEAIENDCVKAVIYGIHVRTAPVSQ